MNPAFLDFIEFSLSGLSVGALYALTGIGFVVVYKATRIINFAIGEFMMIGAYFFFGLAAKEVVEAQSANANRMPRAQISWRYIGIGHRDAAQAFWLALQRIEHCGIVAAMRTPLHQHAARKSDRIEHAEILFQRRIGRRVAAIGRVGKARHRTEDMRMRIAGASGQRNLRRRRFARRRAGIGHIVIRRGCRRL